jgi:hypothetical protein
MKAYYEALRVGESLNRDKNASNNRIENREGSRDKKTLKMLFNIIFIIGKVAPVYKGMSFPIIRHYAK